MNLVKEIRMTNTEENHSKEWTGQLYDDETVITLWGKINGPQQSKAFPGVGQSFLDKKYQEKLRKGYLEENLS